MRNNPEQGGDRLPEKPVHADITRALANKEFIRAKELWVNIHTLNRQEGEKIARTGTLDEVTLGMVVLQELRKNIRLDPKSNIAKEDEAFLLAASENPESTVAILALGYMKKAGFNLDIMRRFNEEKDEAKKLTLARYIAMTQPALPREVQVYFEQYPDVLIAIRGAADIAVTIPPLDINTKFTDDEINIIDTNLKTGNKEAIRDIHTNKISSYRKAALRRAISLGNGITEGPELDAATDRIFALVSKSSITLERFAIRNTRKTFTELIEDLEAKGEVIAEEDRKLLEASAGVLHKDRTLYYSVAEQRFLTEMLEMDDTRYYRMYVDVIQKDMPIEEKNNARMAILQAALFAELRSGKKEKRLTRRVLQEADAAVRFVIEDAKEAVANSPISTVAKAVTTAAVVDAFVSPSQDPEQNPDIDNMITDQSMKTALVGAAKKPRSDGSVEVMVQGQPLVFKVRSGKLNAFVESDDGSKKFYLDEITVQDLEKKTILGAVQYNLDRALWSEGNSRDKKIIKEVFKIDLDDQRLVSAKGRNLYEKSLQGMRKNIRRSVVELYKSLGVIGANMEVNRVRALKVSSLFAYLDARVGLERIEEEQLLLIAKVWQQAEESGKPIELMTPQEASSILEEEG